MRRTRTKPLARSMGTQAMWIATLVGSRWYAPYCRESVSEVRTAARCRIGRTYEDEVLLQIEKRHVGNLCARVTFLLLLLSLLLLSLLLFAPGTCAGTGNHVLFT